MKERPILFSAPMVRAILNGSKTQTRRVVNYPPFDSSDEGIDVAFYSGALKCPYGEIGARLWVREAHRFLAYMPTYFTLEYLANGHAKTWDRKNSGIQFREPVRVNKKRPSIHMPRWASRITLEITNIRVERLQDISEEDARAEGVESIGGESYKDYDGTYNNHPLTAMASFRTLWQSSNGTDSWAQNPWTWVIEFKRIK